MIKFREILDGCCEDDREQQKLFYEYFAPRMMGICLRYASDEDSAKDILQDAFIKIFNKIQGFTSDTPEQLYSWVKKIVTNSAIDYYRMTKNHHFDIDEMEIEDKSDGVDLSYLDIKNIEVGDIVKAMQGLTPRYRAVFNLYVMEGFSHQQIAEELEISVGTSKSNLHKAKKNLKLTLEV